MCLVAITEAIWFIQRANGHGHRTIPDNEAVDLNHVVIPDQAAGRVVVFDRMEVKVLCTVERGAAPPLAIALSRP